MTRELKMGGLKLSLGPSVILTHLLEITNLSSTNCNKIPLPRQPF